MYFTFTCCYVAGLAGIAKVILAAEYGTMFPNLHYKEPNQNIPALHDGRIKVVNEPVSWSGGIAGVNSFGFGGANVHAIMSTNCHSTLERQQDTSIRLLVLSGRTEASVQQTLHLASVNESDVGLHGLLDAQVNLSIKTHPARGYAVLNSPTQDQEVQVSN